MMLRRHFGALILAVIVGAAIAAPTAIAIHNMGPAYQGLSPLASDEIYYLARAHETFDGHPTLGNPYLVEHKATPGVQFWIADTILARIDRLLFDNTFETLVYGNLFWDFVLSFLNLLATYAVIYALTKKRGVALLFAPFLILGLFYLPLTRTPYPELICIFLAAYFALIQMNSGRWRLWAGIATVLGGTLFYIYPFFWTYWVVLLGVVTVLSWLFHQESREYLRYALILLGTLIIGIPYYVGNYAATKLPYYAESLARIGVIHTHFPSGIEVVVLAVLTLALYVLAWRKKYLQLSSPAILALAGSLAGAVVMNQHVITGLNFQFVVHYTISGVFMSVFALVYLGVAICSTGLERFSRYRRLILGMGVLGVALFTLWSLTPHLAFLSTPHSSDLASERYGPVLKWLDANTNTDDVVYADAGFSIYVPAYTRDNVFFSRYVYNAYLPESEVEGRYLGSRYFDGPLTRADLIRDEVDVFGAPYEGEWQHTATTNKVRKIFGLAPIIVEQYPEAEIAKLISEENAVQKGSFRSALGGYQADYLVWDSVLDPHWNLSHVPGLTELYSSEGIIVYKISK